MHRSAAALGSAAFFLAAPGTVVGVIPWLITGWELREPFPDWAVARLVITGGNRWVRNPMYVGLVVVLLGETLLFGQLPLLGYAAVAWACTASFVRWYEEPTLLRQFGEEYAEYRRAVPAWWPRLRPWTPTRHSV